jgi:hypothetical protein
MRVAIFFGALLASVLCASGAQAADKRPKPPAQICVGANCVATPEPGGKIKWNPGHYAAGNGWLLGSTSASTWYGAMDGALKNYPLFKGFRLWISWGTIEKGKGVYDFSQIDAIMNRLKTQYGTPRQLVLTLYPSNPAKWSAKDNRIIPTYITTDKAYGPSPVGGSYGWWGPTSDGQSTGGYEPALWRPAVMERFTALLQAIAAHYDNDPNFEAIMFQEGIYHTLAAGSDYTQADMLVQIKNMLTATVAAFPHTSVVYENSYGLGGAGDNQNFELWMVENRVIPGNADTVGAAAFNVAGKNPPVSWGFNAYMGVTVAGSNYSGGDLRSRTHAMVDIEADDLAGPYFQKYGGPFTPTDICNAINTYYKASHAFWDHFTGTELVKGQALPAAALWPNLAAALAKCPLTNTSYPANYP